MKLHQYQPNEHGVCIYREDDFICCGLSNSERHQLPEPTPPTPPINAPIHSAWCTCHLCQEWVAKHLAHAVEPTPPTETQPEVSSMHNDRLREIVTGITRTSVEGNVVGITHEVPTVTREEVVGIAQELLTLRAEEVTRITSLAVAAPTERVDDVIARMIQEVAPAPLCVSETAVRQLRPLLEELAQRRERVETSPVEEGRKVLAKHDRQWENNSNYLKSIIVRDVDYYRDMLVHAFAYSVQLQRELATLRAAVAPSPAGELLDALKVLYADVHEYNTINYMKGANNNFAMLKAVAAIKKAEGAHV